MINPYDAGYAAGRTWRKHDWPPLPAFRMMALISPLMSTHKDMMSWMEGFDSGYEAQSRETPE